MGFWEKLIYDYKIILNKNNEANENRELILIFFRIFFFISTIYILLFSYNIHIIITYPLVYLLDKLFWNIFITWYVLDYIHGYFIYLEDKYINNKNYKKLISIFDLILKIKYDLKDKNLYNNIKFFKIKNIIYIINYVYIFYNYLTNFIYNSINININNLFLFWIKLNNNNIFLKKNNNLKNLKNLNLKNLKNSINNKNNFIKINEIGVIDKKDKHKLINFIFNIKFSILYIIKYTIFLLINILKKFINKLIIYVFNINNLIKNIKLSLIYIYLYIYSNKYINKYIYIIFNNIYIYIIKYNFIILNNNNIIKIINNNNIINNINYYLFNKYNYIDIFNILYNNYYIYYINKIKIIYNNIYEKIDINKIILEIKIYYVNKKIPYKKFKINNNIYIIKYLDYLEYSILTKKKYFEGYNIIRYHKKNNNNIKKIPSIIEKNINIYKDKYKTIINNNSKLIDNKLNLIKFIIKNLIKLRIDKSNFYKIDMTQINLIKFIVNTNINKIIPNILNNYINNINIIKIYNIYILNKNFNINNNNIIIKKINNNINFNSFNNINFNSFNNINFNSFNNINFNKFTLNLYILLTSPIIILNSIISDICLSTHYLIKFKKNKKKIKIFLKKFKNIFIRVIKSLNYIILFKNLIRNKTIYIIFLLSYIFNSFFIEYLYKAIILNNNIFNYINIIILNKYQIYTILTILGLLITIKWSRGVHYIYGNYLWTMIAFPLFLESHKILYLKIFFLNIFNLDTIENIIALKLNILNTINYKIYNLYNLFGIFIIIFFLMYCIKKEAFKSIYANLRATRWEFIKFPIIIIFLEIFRIKIIKLISIFILYSNISSYILNIFIYINNNIFIKLIIYFINIFIYEIKSFPYYILYIISTPNFYIINFLLDFLIFIISLNWLLIYLRKYLNLDKKYVAFPLVTSEIIIKYIIYFYTFYYLFIYTYTWINDGKLIWYGTQSLFLILFYLEIRVHKIPKKTVAWYFRQIVDLWPSTCCTVWTLPEYLHLDQQKYLAMRIKFKKYKLIYKNNFDKSELWEKKVILKYQREKELYLYIFTSFCKLMTRKESMLKEFNVFDYYGWQYDWTYNYKKINIFKWKLDWWDKPHIYFFKKNIILSYLKFYFFYYHSILYRFSCKYNFLLNYELAIKSIDYLYTNMYLHNLEVIDNNLNIKHSLLFRAKKYKNSCSNWKVNIVNESNEIKRLKDLKKLKKILMEFSSGKRLKTLDWVFPLDYDKQYKKDGWKMFENKNIDSIELDWRPEFSEW
uniref:Ymf77 n=1 Tax=Tetrahymena pigmentosa TaxID=5907 RepID=Q09F08_TETPI|nr:Ymf77 [Tetrahymena pigmentosa]ABI51743.1 Ymf77 [Tetrahymena pigmentosa]